MERHMFWSQPKPWANSMVRLPRPMILTLIRREIESMWREDTPHYAEQGRLGGLI